MSEQGTIKWFNPAKRYGFIKPSGAERDIFFHGSAVLSDADSDALDGGGGEGIVVSFERHTREGRPVALNVRIIDGE